MAQPDPPKTFSFFGVGIVSRICHIPTLLTHLLGKQSFCNYTASRAMSQVCRALQAEVALRSHIRLT